MPGLTRMSAFCGLWDDVVDLRKVEKFGREVEVEVVETSGSEPCELSKEVGVVLAPGVVDFVGSELLSDGRTALSVEAC